MCFYIYVDVYVSISGTSGTSGSSGSGTSGTSGTSGSSGSSRSGGSSAGKAEALSNGYSFLSGGVLHLAWIDRVKGLQFRV